MHEHNVSEPKVLERGRRVANNLAEAADASMARSFTARMRGGVGIGLWRQAVGVAYNHERRLGRHMLPLAQSLLRLSKALYRVSTTHPLVLWLPLWGRCWRHQQGREMVKMRMSETA